MTGLIIGTLLAVVALAVVLAPLFRRAQGAPTARDPSDDALEALIRAERDSGPRCVSCGPRPEPDATFCSTCGRAL